MLAAQWFQRSADYGLAAGQFSLGIMYSGGLGLVRDMAQARRWFEKAAEQDHTEAQYNVGMMYATGQGGE